MKGCTCIPCDVCKGTGNLWECIDGNVSSYRGDDLDDLVTCDCCRGRGTEEECDYCEEIKMNTQYDEMEEQ